jgi:hypothetical protein
VLLAKDKRLAKLLMPISGSTSEKHFSTRTAAATEDRRELLDVEVSEIMSADGRLNCQVTSL